ncbi:helix-turn-helix domain-containing protein, partial [Saccharopolyspora erythraea]
MASPRTREAARSKGKTPLRQAREAMGWTRAYVAEKLEVSSDTVSNWETGKTPMRSGDR